MGDSECKVGVVFDMQFGNLMHQRDLGNFIFKLATLLLEKNRDKST
jgi:hypothetical protein